MLTLPLLVQVLVAGPVSIPVAGSATFTGGIYGTWDFTFVSGPTDLYLEQIAIDLSPTDVRFDTYPGGFGSLTSLDIGGFQGTDVTTGMDRVFPGTGATLDGGQLLTFYFNGFTVGDTFHFTGDVDNPDPTLVPLRDCSGLKGLARLSCIAQNALATTENNARLAAAALVTSREFSGALVTYTFGGHGYYTSSFTTGFEPAGGGRIFGSVNPFDNDVEPTPEPATFLPFAAGLLLLGLRRRRQAR
jgi:hypothetical protein